MNTTVAKRIDFQSNHKANRDANTVVLFRDMDFYFMYNEDAETVAQIFGATEKVHQAEGFAWAAFSTGKLDQYLPVIIRKGHKVTIVDYLF